jgi:hypothetical protein
MYRFPKEPRKIRERIRRYERTMRKEFKEYGGISDGYGKRYLLGPLYLLLDDVDGAIGSFEWFEQTFPDDIGEPVHYLCWALALYRSGDLAKAMLKLRQAMLSNLYLIPKLLGITQDELDVWHHSNLSQREYVEYWPPGIWSLWNEAALQWAKETYHSPELRQLRARFIEIHEQLKSEPRGSKRSELIEESFRLQGWG